MRLPPPAMRWPASSGIRATSLCIRSRMTALTWLRSAATSWIIGSSEGARAAPIGWTLALIWRAMCAGPPSKTSGRACAGHEGTGQGGMKEVLVLGGYGGFGGRVARQLARTGFAVIVAGRSMAKARAFCARHIELGLRPLALARETGLGGERP